MKKTPYKIMACVTLLMFVSACGGQAAKKAATPTAETTEDITRPPTISRTIVRKQQQNPDEAISFDKWKKNQKTSSEPE